MSSLGGNSHRCTLTRSQELRLIRASKKGDQKALEALIASHIRYIAKIASEYRRMGLLEEDLLGEGLLGFVEAVYRYQAKHKSRFITYAYWWIRKNILAALSRETSLVHVPHDRLQNLFQLRRIENRLSQRLGHRPNREELALHLRTTVQKVEATLNLLHYRAELGETNNGNRRNGNGTRSWKFLRFEDPLSHWLTRESHSRLRLAINQLPKRERAILTKRFGLSGGKSFTLLEIARRMGLSKERVRQIESRAKKRVRTFYLELEGRNQPEKA